MKLQYNLSLSNLLFCSSPRRNRACTLNNKHYNLHYKRSQAKKGTFVRVFSLLSAGLGETCPTGLFLPGGSLDPTGKAFVTRADLKITPATEISPPVGGRCPHLPQRGSKSQ
jgi:hypothetical protein